MKGLALRRLGLVGLLLGGWCVHALRSPVSGVAALKSAMAKKAPAKPGAASVSWVNDGAPLGLTGESIQAFVAAAEKRGDLDKAKLSNGMTFAQALERARAISDEANARAEEAGGGDPSEIPRLIVELQSPHEDARAIAAMLLADNRLAKSEKAGEAVPGLESLAANKNEEGSAFAEIALKRIRFWNEKRRGGAKP